MSEYTPTMAEIKHLIAEARNHVKHFPLTDGDALRVTRLADALEALTTQLQAAQAAIAEARDEYEVARSRGWAPARVSKMYAALSRADTTTLAEHDRQVRAKALEEAAQMADSRGHLWSGAPSTELFKLADEIRAAAIRSGEQ